MGVAWFAKCALEVCHHARGFALCSLDVTFRKKPGMSRKKCERRKVAREERCVREEGVYGGP